MAGGLLEQGGGARCAATVVGALCLSACFYVPPISEVPEELDTPPFVLGFEPDVVVDRREDGELRLSVDAVYDLNEFEQIEWTFWMFLTPNDPGPFPLDSDTLRQRATQSFPDATEYDGPEIVLGACDTLDRAAGGSDVVIVSLELVDPLPASQRREGFEQFSVTYSWRVRLTGECPQ